ncbi:MAG: peptidase C1 [Bacteroidetes bacterium]|nr:peptidase C1 [Bacteroidota bacterium]MBP8752671.1 peptidase C1A papain [Chitinophagales bacterium]MBK7110097.1 peptidase C1 [Bacteroidota bacterium]MBK8680564.1 peptidase C1 [Bacteroidota bacterium]MBP9188525.1 peptidase C1A papain [Chitinophagales bacterium]
MPIRMVEDPNEKRSSNTSRNTRSTGGGGMGAALIPLLFSLFRKNPKSMIFVIIAGIAIYYFAGSKSCNSGDSSIMSSLFTGLDFNPEQYDNVEIFEPLADNVNNPLPEKISLEKFAPQRLNQGQQGSCVGWGSAYSARTILESIRTGKNPNDIAFSPSFLYNQISLDGCQGAYLNEAMDVMKGEGLLPFQQFPYNENECSKKPSAAQMQAAAAFKMPGYNRLTQGDTKGIGNEQVDMLAIKQNLAQGAPVVIGMMVGGSFMQDMMGADVWIPTSSDYNMRGFGGHCMTVIGYDDYKEGGAFQLMNSWGSEWGKNGLAWVRYQDFATFTKEAYGIYPMGNPNKPLSNKFNVAFGLVNTETNDHIALSKTGPYIFKTIKPIAKGDKFKIEVTNSQECYTYVFGKETDGSNYTLFPYTEKHSPYCGITGTRLFPKDYSMQADDIGNADFIAIVVTKQPLDYKSFNDKVNSMQGNYENKIADALGGQLLDGIQWKQGETIGFETNGGDDGAVLMVIEIDKN